MEDQVLVEKLLNKDPDAFEWLFKEYNERVKAVVRRLIRDERDVEEVVQDTFWTVYRKIHLFRQDSALWSWMYRIAVNAAKMKIRKYKRRPIPVDDDVLRSMSMPESLANLDSRPDQQLSCKRIMSEMQDFLDECDDTNRSLYIAMEVHGISKEEIAEQLDLSVPAVKTRLHRMRVGLKERISSVREEEGVAA